MDIRFYEFLLKLNTYLRRVTLLSEKFSNQELDLGRKFADMKANIHPMIFNSLIAPIANLLDERVKTMGELREANDGLEEILREYYDYFKGTVQ